MSQEHPSTSKASPVAVRVSRGAERRLREGSPWVRAADVRSVSREAPAGETAIVFDRRGRLLAVGLYDPDAPIRVRVLAHGRPQAVDGAFLRERLVGAAARRRPLADAGHTGYRVVHGEHDGLPGLVVDRYERTLVLRIETAVWARWADALAAAAAEVCRAERVVLRLAGRLAAEWRGASSGEGSGADDGDSGCTSPTAGPLVDGAVLAGTTGGSGEVTFRENGLLLHADVLRGNKTGWFFDQRENRARLAGLCAGASVLDVFSYTGGFSVNAARGGAREVTSVDASAPALAFARRNVEANRDHPAVAAARHEVVAGDAFDVLAARGRAGRLTDVVVLDPPAFARRASQVPGALAAYASLVRLGLGVLEREGVLVFACCSRPIGERAFVQTVTEGARHAGRPLEVLAVTGQPPDHPVAFAGGAYLKCLFARTRQGSSPGSGAT